MEINKDLVKKISKLSQLKIKDLDEFTEEFSKIVTYFEKLDKFKEYENHFPLVNPIENNLTLREDMPKEGLEKERILNSSSTVKDDHFEVPKIIK